MIMNNKVITSMWSKLSTILAQRHNFTTSFNKRDNNNNYSAITDGLTCWRAMCNLLEYSSTHSIKQVPLSLSLMHIASISFSLLEYSTIGAHEIGYTLVIPDESWPCRRMGSSCDWTYAQLLEYKLLASLWQLSCLQQPTMITAMPATPTLPCSQSQQQKQ